MSQSIFQYIIDHLDEDGCYTETTLPDIPITTIPRVLGEIEAAFYIADGDDITPNDSNARKLISMINDYLNMPSAIRRKNLYDTAKDLPMGTIAEYFCNNFSQTHMTDSCFDLARSLFYNSQNREPVKLAYLLFAIYGMSRIHQDDPELWHDLLACAHCEEFTFFFLFACRHEDYEPQRDFWQLLGCTKGWGKVFTLLDVHCENDYQRLWLIKHGMDFTVDFPSVAIKIIVDSRLAQFLGQQSIDPDAYKGALTIINAYLVFASQAHPSELAEDFNLEQVELPRLLASLLHHAQELTQDYGDYLDLMSVTITLRRLIEENNYSQLSMELIHELIAAFDKLIYRVDWQQTLNTELIVDDTVNYDLCDMSFELELDIWEQLYDFWLQHPLEFKLFPYLLPFEGQHRSERVLNHITELLPIYASHQDALLIPLRYLRQFPGIGEAIVYAGLTGIFDWPRGVACVVLDAWGPEYLTPHLIEGLVQARSLSQNNVINMRVEALLKGTEFRLG